MNIFLGLRGNCRRRNNIDVIFPLSDRANGLTKRCLPHMKGIHAHTHAPKACYSQVHHCRTFILIISFFRISIDNSELLSTPDGGTVSVDWAPSVKTMPADDTPTLVLLHGLTGGSHESYIRALVETMTKDHGYRCVVFNARACANTELTSAQLYSGNWTDDLRMVVKHIRKTLPESKLMSVGFSLGANILMNYMGEEGDQCEFLGAMSVGNPFDILG